MSAFKNQVIWITGASSGIGEALAYKLAGPGVRLILSGRRVDALERVKGNCPAALQRDIRVLPMDLASHNTLQLVTEAAIQLFGRIDIMIHNAGMGQRSLVKDTSLDVYQRLMNVNFFGTVALTTFLLPHFSARRRGHFVVITSLTGKFGTPYRAGYAASKHALHGFFDSLRAEHHREGIHVTLVCPGFIRTGHTMHALTADGSPLGQMDRAQYRGMPASQCAKRIVSAIRSRRREVCIGGREVWGVWLKRFFPGWFATIIRKVAVR